MLILATIVSDQLGQVLGILRVRDGEFDAAASVTVIKVKVVIMVVIMRVVEASVKIRVSIVNVEVVSVGVWLVDVEGSVGGWLVKSTVAWRDASCVAFNGH